jgi:dTDP-4-amino-4,6-dideoxygalactose transaminase
MMKLQMVDLHAQVAALRTELEAAIGEVLDSAAFVRGPFVERFERELTDYHGGVPAVSCANGTDALQLGFMAAGVGAGDEVIVPSFTFFATAEAASVLGATPVFVDIRPDTFNIDPAGVEAAITERTKAIVPVHLFGQPADMDAVMELARSREIAVIEDNAQAIGATYKDRITGTIGRFGTLSFYPSKNLSAYGDGGAITAPDPDDADAVRRLANHGTTKKYFHTEIGINSRLDALQAAILSVKLPYLAGWTAARQAAAGLYDEMIAASDVLAGLVVRPAIAPSCTHVFHQYVVRVPAGWRDALADHLKSVGVPTMVYYPHPLHLLPAFDSLGYREGTLPHSEKACSEVLALPMHPHLAAAEIAHVVGAMAAFAERVASPLPA